MGARPAIGGSLEILAYVLSYNVAVWVWVPCGDGTFRRTTCFDLPAGQVPAGRIDLCYLGGTHYDWLRLSEAEQIGRAEHIEAAVEAPQKRKRDQV